MSTKVVHLSTDAHALAKKHCKENGLKMSDWVANLIRQAISEAKKESIANNVRELNPPKKPVSVSPVIDAEQQVPAWAQPPFWAHRAQSNR